MTTFFLTPDTSRPDAYRYGNISIAFNQSLSAEARKAILEMPALLPWLDKADKVFGAYGPIRLAVNTAISFDGHGAIESSDGIKDIIGEVGTGKGGRGVIISRSAQSLLLIAETVAKNGSPPNTHFLLTRAPRFGIPDNNAPGLLGGVITSDASRRGFEAHIRPDVQEVLREVGWKGHVAPFKFPYASIANSGNEVVEIYSAKLTLTGQEFSVLQAGVERLGDDKTGRKIELAQADKVYSEIETRPVDAIPVIALGAYGKQSLQKFYYNVSDAVAKRGEERDISVSSVRRLLRAVPTWAVKHL
jgi:hypothetical protein